MVEREASAVAGRFMGNRNINLPYPATGPPSLCFHGRRAERLDRRATAVRATNANLGELLQTGGSHADAGNGTLEPVAVCIGPHYGTVGPFRPPGATGTRWSVLLAWKRGTAPCVAGPEGKRRA